MESIDNNVAIWDKYLSIKCHCRFSMKIADREINPLTYLKEISYQYKTGFNTFEALLPSITDGDLSDYTEIDDILVATPTKIP